MMDFKIFNGKKGNGKTRKMLDYMNENNYHYIITDNPQALQVKINSLKYDIVAMTFEDFCNSNIHAPVFIKDVDKIVNNILIQQSGNKFAGGTIILEEIDL